MQHKTLKHKFLEDLRSNWKHNAFIIMGVRRHFSKGRKSTFCLSFSGCWWRNANAHTQMLHPF